MTGQLDLFLKGGSVSAPTATEIDAAKTPRGGWTRQQLAQWGVPWPPRAGWKRRLIAQSTHAAFREPPP
jgi:hypothetical protein